MRIYIIANDGITLCREAPAAMTEGEIAVNSKEELHAAPLNAKRLLALWNALPGVTFGGPDQLAVLKKASTLPRHIEIMMENFDKHLTPEELADPRFRFQVAFVQRTANRPSSADQAIEFVVAGTEEAKEIDRILLKEVEKKKYLPNEIVKIMKTEGFRKFNMHQHTLLWKKLDAKKKEKGYGAVAIGGTWGWYENWLARVREECGAHPERYT
jgi:hypothetical protein